MNPTDAELIREARALSGWYDDTVKPPRRGELLRLLASRLETLSTKPNIHTDRDPISGVLYCRYCGQPESLADDFEVLEERIVELQLRIKTFSAARREYGEQAWKLGRKTKWGTGWSDKTVDARMAADLATLEAE